MVRDATVKVRVTLLCVSGPQQVVLSLRFFFCVQFVRALRGCRRLILRRILFV